MSLCLMRWSETSSAEYRTELLEVVITVVVGTATNRSIKREYNFVQWIVYVFGCEIEPLSTVTRL